MFGDFYDLQLQIDKLRKRCCCNFLGTTEGAPTEAPLAGASTVRIDLTTGIIYYWDGNSWEQVLEVEQGLSMGSPIKLGDDIEGVTEGGVLTSERIINHDGFPLVHAGDARVAANVAGGANIRKLLDLQSGSAQAWYENILSADNAGSATNNFIFTEGFNISPNGTRIDPTRVAFGVSWEFHYEPGAGTVYVERHLLYIDLADVQHRLGSHTIQVGTPSQWEEYQTLSKIYTKDPANGGTFFGVQRASTTGVAVYLLGSASEDGAQITIDVSATNAAFQPYGLGGTSKILYMHEWDDVRLPSIRSYTAGGSDYSDVTGLTGTVYSPTSAAGTLSLDFSGWYTFTGTTATWSVAAMTGAQAGLWYHIKNRGSGNITLDVTGGASTIYTTSAVASTTVVPGAAIWVHGDGTFWNIH